MSVPKRHTLVCAVIHVTGSTAACHNHGDEAFFETLRRYYELVDTVCGDVGGRVVKFMGDGVIMTFPVDHAAAAVGALRQLQQRATTLWREFDAGCKAQIKARVGSVLVGELAGRSDVIGDVLNQLIKLPGDQDMLIDETLGRIARDSGAQA